MFLKQAVSKLATVFETGSFKVGGGFWNCGFWKRVLNFLYCFLVVSVLGEWRVLLRFGLWPCWLHLHLCAIEEHEEWRLGHEAKWLGFRWRWKWRRMKTDEIEWNRNNPYSLRYPSDSQQVTTKKCIWNRKCKIVTVTEKKAKWKPGTWASCPRQGHHNTI